ncbi:MAG: rhomboid family intramembrane serine protease [Roseinatronobacter sp.]
MLIPVRDHNPSGGLPWMTWALIALNIVIYLTYSNTLPNDYALMAFFDYWGMVPAYLSQGAGWETLLTHQFLHGDLLHLGSNMLFLWIFGDNMEEEWGHFRFLLFYLTCGVLAAGLQYAVDPMSQIPMVGASGAISGVLGGYLLLFPRARIDLFLFLLIYFRLIPTPAWVVLGGWFTLQILGGVSAPVDEGGVAYWAHAGGFVAGLVLAWPLWRRLGGRGYWAKTHGHPQHPEARYTLVKTDVPRVGRKPGPWG